MTVLAIGPYTPDESAQVHQAGGVSNGSGNRSLRQLAIDKVSNSDSRQIIRNIHSDFVGLVAADTNSFKNAHLNGQQVSSERFVGALSSYLKSRAIFCGLAATDFRTEARRVGDPLINFSICVGTVAATTQDQTFWVKLTSGRRSRSLLQV